MALSRTPNKKFRTVGLALLLATWAARPRNAEEFEALLDAQAVPEARRKQLRDAFRLGGVVYFLADTRQYATRSATIPPDRMTREFLRAISAERLYLRGVARELVLRETNVDEFAAKARAAIEAAIWDAALLLLGPLLYSLPAILNTVLELIRRQIAFFDNLLAQVLSGQQAMDGTLLRRLMMYAGGGWAAMGEVARQLAYADGFREERNILGIAEHCGGCVGETARGWVPIGTLIPVGERDCLSNCLCTMEFR